MTFQINSQPAVPSDQTFQTGAPAAQDPTLDTLDDQSPVFEYGGQQYTQKQLANLLKSREDRGQFIETLKGETAQLRSMLETALAKLEESRNVSDVLRATGQSTGTPAAPEAPAPAVPPPPSAPAIDPADIAAKVQAKLAEDAAKAKQDANFTECASKLQAAFGNKTDEVVAKVAAENDLTMEEAVVLARTKPKAFLKLFPQLTATPSAPATPGSSVRAFAMGLTSPPPKKTGIDVYVKGDARTKLATYQERLQAYLNK